jgi:hypothetical protein
MLRGAGWLGRASGGGAAARFRRRGRTSRQAGPHRQAGEASRESPAQYPVSPAPGRPCEDHTSAPTAQPVVGVVKPPLKPSLRALQSLGNPDRASPGPLPTHLCTCCPARGPPGAAPGER